MTDTKVGIFWTPAGFNIPDIGTKALIDVTDGDTPTIQMPIRMLSVDTPEVTAKTDERAAQIDAQFLELAGWIEADQAPVSPRFAEYILPKLKTGKAGTAQLAAGRGASAWYKAEMERRLTKPNGKKRRLFVRVADAPFDNYGRLLAYIAPFYDAEELPSLSREDRATFNLGLVESGWAAPFILYPSIPGELDLPLFVTKSVEAFEARRGQWADEQTMPGYEYRMIEKLYQVTKRLVKGEKVPGKDRYAWRSRYCASLITKELFGPEDYMSLIPPHRMWFWQEDVQDAVSKLNLIPSGNIVGA
jgi:endonuclease YncB( thermonuclease family)